MDEEREESGVSRGGEGGGQYLGRLHSARNTSAPCYPSHEEQRRYDWHRPISTGIELVPVPFSINKYTLDEKELR